MKKKLLALLILLTIITGIFTNSSRYQMNNTIAENDGVIELHYISFENS